MKIHEKLKKLGDHLEGGLIGRRDHARMLLLAAVAGENAILFGPPGTAKSLLARRLKDCFADDIKYFECLLTKFSMPEEVFGPVSLKGLEQDIFRRVYDRYMPGAGVAFIDETFKANSAILNSMLTILNEREFDTGNERIKVPLRCVVGASNEMPKEAELEALYDRFIIRMRVDRLQDEGQLALFLQNATEYEAPTAELRLTKADLESVVKAAKILPVEAPVIDLLVELREWCHGKGIKISDRRLGKIKRLLQVAAFTSDRAATSLSDAWVVRHCAWDDFTTDQAEKLAGWLDSRIDKQQHNLSGLRALVDAEKKAYAAKAKIQKKDASGRLVYLSANGMETAEATAEGYAYSAKDDNNGLLYSADEIKEKLWKNYPNNTDYRGTKQINVKNSWINLDSHFESVYAQNKVKHQHKPKFEDGIYTVEQREKFKASAVAVLSQLKGKSTEISQQAETLTLSMDASPWAPKEYQESHLAGLKGNLEELEKFEQTLQGVIAGYDKLLTTSDPEKLTDPQA
jgi:MoxR-like ATPase